jgi:ADP-L-glycero-D-manno-heptose 6-epimerase
MAMILVTGGAGFIGSNLVASLNERGVNDVVVNDDVSGGKAKNLEKRRISEIVPPADLFRWLGTRKLDAVLHMGAISSTTATDERAVMAANFDLPMRLLDWCAERRTPLLYASSAATYGDGSQGFDDDGAPAALAKLRPLNLYGYSKHRFDFALAEHVAARNLLPPQWVGLKFFNVFGPNEYHKGEQMSVVAKSFPRAKASEPVRLFRSSKPRVADGEQKRDFIYVEDAADVVLWVLDHPAVSGLYNVGTGRARAFNDLIASLFRALGRPPLIEYVDMPPELASRYQYLTEARMERLRKAGYDKEFTPLEAAVERYVTRYLDRDDPYR